MSLTCKASQILEYEAALDDIPLTFAQVLFFFDSRVVAKHFELLRNHLQRAPKNPTGAHSTALLRAMRHQHGKSGTVQLVVSLNAENEIRYNPIQATASDQEDRL